MTHASMRPFFASLCCAALCLCALTSAGQRTAVDFPEDAHQLMASHPHVAYAVLLAQVSMGMVDPEVAEVRGSICCLVSCNSLGKDRN